MEGHEWQNLRELRKLTTHSRITSTLRPVKLKAIGENYVASLKHVVGGVNFCLKTKNTIGNLLENL